VSTTKGFAGLWRGEGPWFSAALDKKSCGRGGGGGLSGRKKRQGVSSRKGFSKGGGGGGERTLPIGELLSRFQNKKHKRKGDRLLCT